MGRKSDIWSFGCILLELVTYVMQGPEAVKAFERSRKKTLFGGWTFYPFHNGRRSHQVVEAKFEELEKVATTAYKGVIKLVKDMLQIAPDDRPNANEVTCRLRFWTLESIFDKVYNALIDLVLHESDLNMIIERERLAFWAQVTGLRVLADHDNAQSILADDEIFRRTFENLERIEEDALAISIFQDDFQARSIKLRMIVDDIVLTLPAKLQVAISNLLEQKLLSTDDLSILKEVQQTLDETSKYRSIKLLAAIKHMHKPCEEPANGHGRRMQLKSVSSKTLKKYDHFTIEELVAEGRTPTQALVERSSMKSTGSKPWVTSFLIVSEPC